MPDTRNSELRPWGREAISADELVGDIPPAILLRIYNIRTSMMPRILARFFEKHILNQRKAVIQDYLELKNKEVDLKYWSENHIQSFISYIEKRLHDDYETDS